MSIDLARRIKALEAKVVELEKPMTATEVLVDAPERFAERLKTLENQYRMLNARLNKKNNKDADDGRRTSNSS